MTRFASLCMRMAFAFFSVFILASCSNDDGNGDIKMQTPTQNTVYADETNATDAIRFVASNPWKASVSSSTRASGVEWLTLSAYSGEAGENSISITLTVNDTGQDRKADIVITTGDTTITITIEQKATTKDGDQPATPDEPSEEIVDGNLITKIIQHNYYKSGGRLEDDGEDTYEFFYDGSNRLVRIVQTETNEVDYIGGYTGTKDAETEVTTVDITYQAGTVAYEMTTAIDGVEQKQKPSGSIVLENGRAVSGTCTDYDEKDSGNMVKYVTTYTLTYDDNGYLVKSSRTEDGKDTDGEVITWANGCPEQVVWGYWGSTQLIDKATYGNVNNWTNIDLNWLLLDSEGWEFAAGDPHKIFAILGYTGRRSTYLASSMTDGAEAANSGGRVYTYSYERSETNGLPLKVTKKTSADYGEESEFTIVYGK